MAQKLCYTVKEAAQVLGTSPASVRALCRRADDPMPHFYLSNNETHIRVPVEALKQWLAHQGGTK